LTFASPLAVPVQLPGLGWFVEKPLPLRGARSSGWLLARRSSPAAQQLLLELQASRDVVHHLGVHCGHQLTQGALGRRMPTSTWSTRQPPNSSPTSPGRFPCTACSTSESFWTWTRGCRLPTSTLTSIGVSCGCCSRSCRSSRTWGTRSEGLDEWDTKTALGRCVQN